MTYTHTQTGYLAIVALFGVVACFGIILAQFANFTTLIVMLLIIFVVASFTSLTVTIDEDYLRLKFGYGLFRKRFLLRDIASAEAVKNHWYYGWGIRLWFWPYMVIYNVSGLDAVAITMHGGKRYRIGTDEPKELEQALRQAIK